MPALTKFTGKAVALPIQDIDTDQIIPARYLKTISKDGLAVNLFNDWRYLPSGDPNPDFVINKPEHAGATILIAGDNFGCGSSREHAPWALQQMGLKAIIAPSFADIFRNNCAKIGLLTVVLPQEDIDRMVARAEDAPGFEAAVDLEVQTVTFGAETRRFEIDPFVKHCLLNGLDDIGLTLQVQDDISAFESKRPDFKPETTAVA